MADLTGIPKRQSENNKYQKIYDDIPEILGAYNEEKWFGYIFPDIETANRARATVSTCFTNSWVESLEWRLGFGFSHPSHKCLRPRTKIEQRAVDVVLWIRVIVIDRRNAWNEKEELDKYLEKAKV